MVGQIVDTGLNCISGYIVVLCPVAFSPLPILRAYRTHEVSGSSMHPVS